MCFVHGASVGSNNGDRIAFFNVFFTKEEANNLQRAKVLFHVNLLFSDMIDV